MTFTFPWHYSFPPFFTLQPHAETRGKQLAAWRSLILDYCQANGITSFDVQEISGTELFYNKEIKRKLTGEALAAVLEDLKAHGNLEWMDKAKRRCHIYWRTPDQWGQLIYTFVKDHGMQNTVCTFYELTEGEDTQGQPFHNLDQELLIKALQTLELQKRAEIFGGDEGVKFF